MKTFQINRQTLIVCESQSTRYGFRHLATLLVNGRETETAKCCYYNRTWESYEFQSVIEGLAGKVAKYDKKLGKKISRYAQTGGRKQAKEESDQLFKTVATVAKIGEIFCTTPKDKNDWKTRMLKAGLGNQGLQIPEDWDTLTEEDKEARLNKTIQFLGAK